ncbi:Ficolin-2 [Bulinus truncatus]|nr:Ficolin-2 [Bulinus truncatus]
METKKSLITLKIMFTFILLQEFCNSLVCPKPENLECTRELEHFYARLLVYSNAYQINLLCDTETDGGGWIIIQRRVKKDESFYRTWKEYRDGFGSLCGDHWLGNENIHRITSTGRFELRIDFVYSNSLFFAVYNNFVIDSESHGYRLNYKNFLTGNTTDMLKPHNEQQFSTPDRDNDIDGKNSCGRIYQAGWWYSNCTSMGQYVSANLNGQYNMEWRRVFWKSVTSKDDSVHAVEMKIRKI